MSESNKERDALARASDVADEQRRDFLRKSVYAAYATPVIMTLLVGRSSAHGSGGGGRRTGEEGSGWGVTE